jgi:hypothetical protein
MCKAIRLSTGSTIEIEIPESIVEAVELSGNHNLAVDWIGEELNWQFIPKEFVTPDGKDAY